MDIFDFSDGREGYYGEYGGVFLPEILHATIEELLECFRECKADPKFWQDYVALMQSYSGRPTPVTHLENLSRKLGGAQIYVKREDLNHTGSHKVNNVMGQGLLCQRLGKTKVIAETGAGQHGFATATMAARFGFDCKIYMGAVDVARQRPNVFWMENLGAEVVAVEDGQKTLKDAINEAMRDWVTNMADTHYILGTACGPHPFPEMVSWFQSIIGMEAREQMIASAADCRIGSTPVSVVVPMPWVSSRASLTMTVSSWWAVRPVVRAWVPTCTLPAWPMTMPLWVSPRALKPTSCRTTKAT